MENQQEASMQDLVRLASEQAGKDSFPGNHLSYGTFFGSESRFTLGDASIPSVDFGGNEVEDAWLEKMARALGDCGFKYERKLEDIARQILQKETRFDLNNYDLYATTGGARSAMRHIVGKVATKERPLVAFGSPNWVFERIFFGVPKTASFSFFAPDAETFVSKFEVAAKSKKIAALVVVDPSNPLGYRFDEGHVNRLEESARQNGTLVIFDDVFRGLQKEGERHSASEYSNSSVVVESTSKRYSAMGLGATWTLVPKGLNLDPNLKQPCQGCTDYAALIIDALSSSGADTKISRRLANGTNSFRRGLEQAFDRTEDTGRIVQSFEGAPFFCYFLPNTDPRKAAERMVLLKQTEVLGFTPGYDWVCSLRAENSGKAKISKEEALLAGSYLRVCPTQEPPHRMYLAGATLGTLLSLKPPILATQQQGKL